jgi:drug/metabolite transporter (DMT)-like permease
LLLMPLVLRDGIVGLGGIGWGRGLIISVLSGPPQAMIAYTGFMLVPLGHGTTIQPACAALFGLILATLVLGERATLARIIGGATIIAGLLIYGVESLTTIGSHGVGGDLLFATAGLFWATFGILLRYWHVSGTRAIAVVGALSIVVFAPMHGLLVGYDGLLRMSLVENLLQAVVQGILAGAVPIFLFARAVMLLGAGRAATFPALVPGFSLIIGYFALGVVPSLAQLIGLVIVVIGFRFALR